MNKISCLSDDLYDAIHGPDDAIRDRIENVIVAHNLSFLLYQQRRLVTALIIDQLKEDFDGV